jgi:uroporphyrinogen decarboxylase
MNGYQRIMAAFHGRRPDTVPVMLHNFMMAAREAGFTMSQFRREPDVIARSFIDAVERYRYDGIIVDIDTVTLAGAAGVPVDFPEHEPARVRGARLRTLEGVRDLEPIDIARYPGVNVWLEAVTRLKHHFGDEVLIRGNCDQCPFTLASMIRGMDEWLMDLLDRDNHENVHALLEYATGITLQFIRLMTGTGCHMLSNGDSVAGPELVSPAIYRAFALPYARRIVDAAHSEGLPYVLHICGNTASIIDDMIATSSDGLELDYKTDSVLARDRLSDRCVFIGNIDPSGVLALGTPELVERRTHDLLTVFAQTARFVLNAGCAIPPTTPSENIEAMIRVARSFQPSS